ncbi:MAG: hypothetical protein IPH08_03750 [Rhodocyclaceae bacterium]|nr:hypothetical protein [Rhodocyclaceae bacterium]
MSGDDVAREVEARRAAHLSACGLRGVKSTYRNWLAFRAGWLVVSSLPPGLDPGGPWWAYRAGNAAARAYARAQAKEDADAD